MNTNIYCYNQKPRRDLVDVFTKTTGIPKYYSDQFVIINLTNLRLTVKNRAESQTTILPSSTDNYLVEFLRYRQDIKNTFDNGVYVVFQNNVSSESDRATQLYYDTHPEHEEHYPVPLHTSPLDEVNSLKREQFLRSKLNQVILNTDYSKYLPTNREAEAIAFSHTRNNVYFVPLKVLLENKYVYHKQSDYLLSIYDDGDMPIHPNSIYENIAVTREAITQTYDGEEAHETIYYCPIDKERARPLYRRSGTSVTKLTPKDPDLKHQCNYIYISYDTFDVETGEYVTKSSKHRLQDLSLPSKEKEKLKADLEKWLNSFGIYYSEKEALASIADRIAIEKVLHEKEALKVSEKKIEHEDRKIDHFDRKLAVEDKKLDIEFRRVKVDLKDLDLKEIKLRLQEQEMSRETEAERELKAQIELLSKKIEMYKLNIENAKINEKLEEIKDRKEERQHKRSNSNFDNISGILKGIAAIIAGAVSLVAAVTGVMSMMKTKTA